MAGRIPQRFVDDLLARIDLVDLIDARVPLRKAGRDYAACCPFHGEKTPSFTVSREKQFYHCFGCGAHGNAIGFLMNYEHLGFIEAVEDLAARCGLEIPKEAAAAIAEPTYEPLYALLQETADFYRRQLREHPQASRAVSYLKGRGMSGACAAEFEVGYAPPGWDNLLTALGGSEARRAQLLEAGLVIQKEGGGLYDRFRDRIMFPIRDTRGRVIGFGGRVLGNETPKYLNSPETPVFHKGRELYGLYQARKRARRLDRLLVVEGYMDVLALAQHEIPYAVATLGTAATRDHIDRLFRAAPTVICCFDGDRAGREAAWRALENALPALREGRELRFMFLPEGEDPDTLVRKVGREAFEHLTAKAVTLSEFFFESLMRRVDIHSIEGRARLVELARPLLSKVESGLLRQLMSERLAELARVESTALGVAGAGKPAPVPPVPARPVGRRGPVRQSPSMLRQAIALLLHRPALAGQVVEPQRYAALRHPGAPLFVELLELIQANPHLNCASILERWRDTETGNYLAKLAQWQAPIAEGIEAEFSGALTKLDELCREQRLEDLLEKSSTDGLTPEEKRELQQGLVARSGAPK